MGALQVTARSGGVTSHSSLLNNTLALKNLLQLIFLTCDQQQLRHLYNENAKKPTRTNIATPLATLPP
jgi:hypothetical protein